MDKVLALLFDPANIGHNTELSRNEILAFSVLATMAGRHNLPVLADFLERNLIYKVSGKRKGRGELIKIVGRHLAMDEQNRAAEQRGGLSRLFRRR
ncbi:MAG: hypothetical protein ACYC0F_18090 [Rhodanobacter sp.]